MLLVSSIPNYVNMYVMSVYSQYVSLMDAQF